MNYNKKIRWISFLMTAVILLSGWNSAVCASTAPGYEVSLSDSVTPIGGEVVLTVALTNVSAQSTQIRGLQIDITGVDADVLEVVSYRSLITDATAASNTPSHSQVNSRVRLVYANFNGTLPVSVGADGKMPVFEVRFKISDALEAGGQIELPVILKIQTTSGQHTLNSSCAIAYGERDTSVNSVNISWTSMQFTYSDGAWNAQSHEYEEGEWNAVGNGGCITVENVGEQSLEVTFSYAPVPQYDNINGSFHTQSGTVLSVTLVAEEEKTVSFRLSGKPSDAIANAALGTITISIGRSE